MILGAGKPKIMIGGVVPHQPETRPPKKEDVTAEIFIFCTMYGNLMERKIVIDDHKKSIFNCAQQTIIEGDLHQKLHLSKFH